MPLPDQHGMDVRHYLAVVRRRKWVVVLCVLVVTASALAFSLLQTPVYEAHARVLIEPNQSLFQTAVGDNVSTSRMQTEIQVIESEPVRAAVLERLGTAPGISATVVGSTAVLDVAAQSITPAEASRVANAYVETYIDYRRKKAIGTLEAATAELQLKITSLDQQIAEADARARAANPPTPERPVPTPTPEQQALQGQRAAFKEKVDQAQVDVALKNGGAQVVTSAKTPTDPIRPTTVRNVLLGLLVGLIVGLGLAFLSEQLDDSLKSKDDFTRAAGGLPVLGVIPRVSTWKNKAESRLISLAEPTSSAAEAYRTLRTSIQFIGVDRRMRTLQVTSPSAADGKTTTIANLALALARAGQRVTVMSCDLRRPRVHEFFGVANAVGFTSVLVGRSSLASAMQPVEGVPRLQVLTCGPIPPNPSELLSAQRTSDIIAAVAGQSDVTLIDCPPVLPVTDAVALSSHVDATLLVATAGMTTGKQLHRAVELLRQVDAPLVGVVMNGASPQEGYGYGYYPYEERPTKPSRAAEKAEANGKAAPTPSAGNVVAPEPAGETATPGTGSFGS